MSAARRIAVPFTRASGCRVRGPDEPAGPGRRPPLLVALHGQGQSGERHALWMAGAAPAHFATAFPDGFHAHEVRRLGRPARLGFAWYLFTGDQQAFADSLAEGEEALWRVIAAAVEELRADPERIWLAGFSQGCYLAHCVAVRAAARGSGGRLAGWIAQGGRLKHEFLGSELPAVAGRPVLVQHGRHDPSLPAEAAERSARLLADHGADVTLRLYDAGHRITPAMVEDVRGWLQAREPP